MKIIFLDIDGVLNCENGYKGGYCNYRDDYGQSFYPPSVDLLNKLIEKTDAKVVISSTWRSSGLKIMQEMWNHRKMAGEIIDITPRFVYGKVNIICDGITYQHRPCRGDEINSWLSHKGFSHIFWSKNLQEEYIEKSGIENYIIIDDDSDMLYNQKEHFIHVKPSPRNKDGFNIKNYDQAIGVLSKNLIDLYQEEYSME